MNYLLNYLAVIFTAVTLSFSATAFPIHKNHLKRIPPEWKISKRLQQAQNEAFNFDGIVKLNNCSGSLVRFNTSLPNQKALVLTNGHCVAFQSSTGLIPPNSYVANQPVTRSFKFLNTQGSIIPGAMAQATRIVYGTMTGTDLALYELSLSYAEIEQKFGAHALTVSDKHPKLATAIHILSGYWQRGYACVIDRFVHELREDAYTMSDSIRYAVGCDTIHGTSGSPIMNAETREVIGINNTGNDSGERCTMDNPCEVNENGDVYAEQGRSYGQQTHQLYTCLNENSEIDLSVTGCKLYH